jgi:hypothetical protein
MPKLSLQVNVPVAAVLLAHGETAASNYGPDQVRYRTDAGDLYVSEVVGALLNQMIAKENIQIGESVVFSKREQILGPGRKGIRWSIERAAAPVAVAPVITPGNGTLVVPAADDALEAHLRASIAQVQERKSAAPLPMTRPVTKLEDALKTVVAAVYAAQQYAREIGFNAMPPFTSEDIRTMANTIMIEGRNRNAAA